MPGLNFVEHNNTRYRVRVSAGPDLQHLRPLNVNDDANPLLIDTDEFSGHVTFRIKGQDQIQGYEEGQRQDGLKTSKDSSWFGNAAAEGRGENLLSSLQVVGKFKREWTGDQVVFAVRMGHCFQLTWPPSCCEILNPLPYHLALPIGPVRQTPQPATFDIGRGQILQGP
jgi:hypothetical protein